MKTPYTLIVTLLLFTLVSLAFAEEQAVAPPNDSERLRELDAYWAEVSRAVGAGDFEGYKATCHESGVLVSGIKNTSQPLAKALARWKPGFDDTKAGKMKASVVFRFSKRLGDAETAYETGIFLYTAETAEGQRTENYIHLEALLIKQQGQWKTLMEYQKSKATKEEWDRLEKTK